MQSSGPSVSQFYSKQEELALHTEDRVVQFLIVGCCACKNPQVIQGTSNKYPDKEIDCDCQMYELHGLRSSTKQKSARVSEWLLTGIAHSLCFPGHLLQTLLKLSDWVRHTWWSINSVLTVFPFLQFTGTGSIISGHWANVTLKSNLDILHFRPWVKSYKLSYHPACLPQVSIPRAAIAKLITKKLLHCKM